MLGLVKGLAAQGLAQRRKSLGLRGQQQAGVQRAPAPVQHHQVVHRHYWLRRQRARFGDQGVGTGAGFTAQHRCIVAALGHLVQPPVFVAEGDLGLAQGVLAGQCLHRVLAQCQHRAILRQRQQCGIVAQRGLQARRPQRLVLLGLPGPGLGLAQGLVGRLAGAGGAAGRRGRRRCGRRRRRLGREGTAVLGEPVQHGHARNIEGKGRRGARGPRWRRRQKPRSVGGPHPGLHPSKTPTAAPAPQPPGWRRGPACAPIATPPPGATPAPPAPSPPQEPAR